MSVCLSYVGAELAHKLWAVCWCMAIMAVKDLQLDVRPWQHSFEIQFNFTYIVPTHNNIHLMALYILS